jgi:anti-sigma B factor antagonist
MASCPEPYPPSEVTVQRRDAAAIVTVSGELDLCTVPELSRIVAEEGDARLLILDLNAVTFIDSTGMRVLIEADRACANSGARLVVLTGDGPVRRVLDLCKLADRLTLVTDHPAPATLPEARTKRRSHDDPASAQRPRGLTRNDHPNPQATLTELYAPPLPPRGTESRTRRHVCAARPGRCALSARPRIPSAPTS